MRAWVFIESLSNIPPSIDTITVIPFLGEIELGNYPSFSLCGEKKRAKSDPSVSYGRPPFNGQFTISIRGFEAAAVNPPPSNYPPRRLTRP